MQPAQGVHPVQQALAGEGFDPERHGFGIAALDLIGLEVVNRQGESLGTVRDLLSTGPQAVLVIEKPTADKPLELMVPFVAAFVDNVDLVARRISVDWQLDY